MPVTSPVRSCTPQVPLRVKAKEAKGEPDGSAAAQEPPWSVHGYRVRSNLGPRHDGDLALEDHDEVVVRVAFLE